MFGYEADLFSELESPYNFKVTDVFSTGKVQLVHFDEYLRTWEEFMAASDKSGFIDSLRSSISTDPTMAPFLKNVFAEGYDAFLRRLEGGAVKASDARYFLGRYYSACQRGAGSRLAGFPLVSFDGKGIGVLYDKSFDEDIVASHNGQTNSVRMSPWSLSIGSPYGKIMKNMTYRVAEAVDRVSKSLSLALTESEIQHIPVEDATQICLEGFDDFLVQPHNTPYPGRGILQMDFFLMYSPEVRKRILDGEITKEELGRLTEEGKLTPYIFDVSGGAGTIGVLHTLSGMHGESVELMDDYARYLVEAYRSRKGNYPRNIVIAPREADLTLTAFEYGPLEEKFEEMGFETHISTAEELQEALDGDGFVVCSDGARVRPQLVARRFTYLGDGEKDKPYGTIRCDLPDEMLIEPSQESRIVASDKRVNSRILSATCNDNIPYIDVPIDEIHEIGEYFDAEDIREKYPEIGRCGLVLKTFDKVASSGDSCEVVSVQPYATKGYFGDIGANVVESLKRKGVYHVVAHPNLVPLFSSNDGQIPPKTEIKMFAVARY